MLFAACPLGCVDEQHGARCDSLDEVDEVWRRSRVRKTAVPAVIMVLMATGPQELPGTLRNSPTERALALLRDHCLHVLTVSGRLQEGLAADRQPEPADATGLDVGTSLQEVDRGEQVALALVPGIGVGIAVALALAASIEDEHAVAVAGEVASVGLGALAPEGDDHGRAVLRRHVRALQGEPVARVELDVLDCSAPRSMSATGGRAACVPTWA